MNRTTLVTVGILVVLVIAYFATSEEPQQMERAPMTVQKVEGLTRIEIAPPAESGGEADASADDKESADGPELIALEKRENGWWLTQPVEAPTAESIGETIEELFGSSISTDDLRIDSGRKSEFHVDDESSAKLSLFGGGESPQVELLVGKQISVEGTGAKRTYVRKPGEDRIYRAQAPLGEFVGKSVDDLRSDKIVDLDKKALTRLEWKHLDGPTIVLEKKKKSWKLLRPEVEWDLDGGAVESIVGALSGLTADDFADDQPVAEIGLEPATVELTAKTKDGETKLLLGAVESDGKTDYFAKLANERFKYKLSTYAGDKLVATLGDIRSKNPRTFDQEAMTEVRFPGEDNVVVRKEDGSWTLVRPQREKSLNESTLKSKLSSIASLTVKGFPEVEPADAGLTAGADRLVFTTEEGRHTILFGDKADEASGDRYVKFDDRDEVYVVTKYAANKLMPKADDLVGKSKGGPGKMPAGLGKGGPGGMNKLQKMKMMQKLKQRMGNR